MSRFLRRVVCRVLLLAAALLAGCGGGEGSEKGTADGGLSLAVIPKGTTHEYWKAVHAGARKAQQSLSTKDRPVEVIWKGPTQEDDRAAQVQMVENFVTRGVDGIVLAPLDAQALRRPVRAATDYGIPVVIVDSALDSDRPVSFVATDNRKGGRLAGERLATLLGGEGKVVMLRYQAGSASTTKREEGFLSVMKEHESLEVISKSQYAGATTETAMKAAENLRGRIREADGVFCPNESSTFGMLRAMQESGESPEAFVGFDVSQRLLEGLREGALDGLVVQDPLKMGESGVRTLVQHIEGEQVPSRIDTGVTLVTPKNMDEQKLQRLLHPPLERYLP